MIALLLQVAFADPPCEAVADGMPIGPADAPMRDGGLGAPRRTCVRSEIGAGASARMTVDLANFYGYIPGAFVVKGGGVVGRNVEIFGRLEAVRLDLAIASLSASNLGMGPLTVGAAWSQTIHPRWSVGAHGSLVLPTQTGLYKNTAVMGIDLGFSAIWSPDGKFTLYQSGVVLGQWGMGAGPSLPKLGADLDLGVGYRVGRAFSLGVDLEAGVGMRGGFDFLAPALALRVSDGKRMGGELAVRVPVVGDQRELLSFGLQFTARLD